MRDFKAVVGQACLLLWAAVLLIGGSGGAGAQDAGKTLQGATPAKSKEKMVAFEMRDKPWNAVLEWLADITGLPVNAPDKPTASLTYIAPRGGPKEYTIPQVIDILNENLAIQKLIIIRRTASIMVVPADKD